MYSTNPTLNKLKRKWQTILWWTLLIAALIFFLSRNNAKQTAHESDLVKKSQIKSREETHQSKKENEENEENGLVKNALTTTGELSHEEPPSLPTQDSTILTDEIESLRTKAMKLNLPKPKVSEDVQFMLTPRMNQSISCGPVGKTPTVLILVVTTADAVSQRNAIRSSWGLPINSHTRYIHDRPYVFKVVFVMGRPAKWGLGKSSLQKEIEEEYSESHDILQLDFEDSKYEYTRKTKNALKWIANQNVFRNSSCRPRFILKVLDDIFINFPAFLHWLDAKYNSSVIKADSNLYTGHLIHHDKPIRNSDHPLHVSSDDYPDQFFPDYIRSPIFLLSWNTALSFTKVINKVRPIAMEDAYIGLLAYKAGTRPIHNEHFVLIGRPDNVCHHLRMFFIGSVPPMEQINTFKRQRHARDIPECFGMLPFHLDNENSHLDL